MFSQGPLVYMCFYCWLSQWALLRQGNLAVDHADTKALSQPGTLPTKRSHDLPLLGTRQSWLHVKNSPILPVRAV